MPVHCGPLQRRRARRLLALLVERARKKIQHRGKRPRKLARTVRDKPRAGVFEFDRFFCRSPTRAQLDLPEMQMPLPGVRVETSAYHLRAGLAAAVVVHRATNPTLPGLVSPCGSEQARRPEGTGPGVRVETAAKYDLISAPYHLRASLAAAVVVHRATNPMRPGLVSPCGSAQARRTEVPGLSGPGGPQGHREFGLF